MPTHTSTAANAKIAIVGGGYSGFTAAIELSAAGFHPDIFEASNTFGGRARKVLLNNKNLDCGQHILLGAYSKTLEVLSRIGIEPKQAFHRFPLHWEIHQQISLNVANFSLLPAPLHMFGTLIFACGLDWHDKFAALFFMQQVQKIHYQLDTDCTVSELLQRLQQPLNIQQKFWRPLCLAALNTVDHEASAQIFLNVLRDSIAGSRQKSDLLLPKMNLTALFPEPAARWLEQRGSSIFSNTRIEAITRNDSGYFLDEHGPYQNVIIALAPYHVARLIARLPKLKGLSDCVQSFRWSPIYTIYLEYPDSPTLPFPMIGSLSGPAQWIFDRNILCAQKGMIAAIISGKGAHEDSEHSDLIMQTHQQIKEILPTIRNPVWAKVIAEKRATFLCTAGLQRPSLQTSESGIWLTGDYLASDYPATIEGAVQSGYATARAVAQSFAT